MLLLTTLGCRAPNSDPRAQATVDAQATSTRRAAAAEVQRIIASAPPPTTTPAPTQTPLPTCANAIWWQEARLHVGESRTIQGPVVATRPAANATAMLEVGQPYPDPNGVVVIVPAGNG